MTRGVPKVTMLSAQVWLWSSLVSLAIYSCHMACCACWSTGPTKVAGFQDLWFP